MRNIREVARLFRVLEADYPKEVKVQQIKMVLQNGDITEEEAVELAVEYFT